MTDITPFLDAEFTEIGLAAAACPQFAEQLIEALRRLPQTRAAESDSPSAENRLTRQATVLATGL
jgi:hypothetical protein